MDKRRKYFLLLLLILAIIGGLFLFFNTSFQSLDVQKSNVTHNNSVAKLAGLSGELDYQELLDRGLTENQAKRLIFAELQYIHRDTESEEPDIYWEKTEAARTALIRQKYTSQQQVRDALIVHFGQAAREEPIFIDVFRPLQKQFPFLTSKEQIALQKLQIDSQISMLSVQQTQDIFSLNPSNLDQFPPIMPKTLSLDISHILDEDSAFEYNLRMSTLAHQLRNSGVDFSEETFRKTYQILANVFLVKSPKSGADLQQMPESTLVDHRGDLDNLLGGDNTLKVMAALDPEFQTLRRKVAGLNLNEEQIMLAYEISLEARKAIFEALRTKESNPEIGIEMIRDAANSYWNQLSQQLGDEVAEQLLTQKRQISANQQPRVVTPPNTIKN